MYDAFDVFNVSVFGFLAIPPEDKEIKTTPPPHTHTQYVITVVFVLINVFIVM